MLLLGDFYFFVLGGQIVFGVGGFEGFLVFDVGGFDLLGVGGGRAAGLSHTFFDYYRK